MSPRGTTLLEWSAQARWNAAVTHLRLAGTIRESKRICEAIVSRRCDRSAVRHTPLRQPPPASPRYAVVAVFADGRREILLDDVPFRLGSGLKELLVGSPRAPRIALAMHLARSVG